MKRWNTMLAAGVLSLAMLLPAAATEDFPDLVDLPVSPTVVETTPETGTEVPVEPVPDVEEITEFTPAPPEIMVQLNGEYIEFTDATPMIVQDRTMVPIRAIVEALGAEVEYLSFTQGSVVNIAWGSTQVSLPIGESSATVTEMVDGAEVVTDLTLDAPAFIAADRTYVPLRFLSESFGLDVHWDADHYVVVILDRDRLVYELDDKLQNINAYLAANAERLQSSWQVDSEFVMDAVVAGIEEPQKLTGSATSYVTPEALAIMGTLNLSEMQELLGMIFGVATTLPGLETGGEIPEEMMSVVAGLFAGKEHDVDGRLLDGTFYVRSSLLDLVDAENAGSYYAFEMLYDPMAFLQTENATMGSLVYDMNVYGMDYMGGPQMLYDTFMDQSMMLVALMGDESFMPVDGGYSLQIDREDLMGVMRASAPGDEIANAMIEELVKQFDFTVTMAADGSYTGSGVVEIMMSLEDADAGNLMITYEQEGDMTYDSTQVQAVVPGMFDISLAVDSTVEELDEAPDLSLPEDAIIID